MKNVLVCFAIILISSARANSGDKLVRDLKSFDSLFALEASGQPNSKQASEFSLLRAKLISEASKHRAKFERLIEEDKPSDIAADAAFFLGISQSRISIPVLIRATSSRNRHTAIFSLIALNSFPVSDYDSHTRMVGTRRFRAVLENGPSRLAFQAASWMSRYDGLEGQEYLGKLIHDRGIVSHPGHAAAFALANADTPASKKILSRELLDIDRIRTEIAKRLAH